MTKQEQIKYRLLGNLKTFEDNLTRITIREYKSIMKLVKKFKKKVEKYYE